jgi:magnesium-transporting ATPase (P-type)
VEQLRRLVPSRVMVRRDGRRQEVDSAELVRGDVVLLGPGDRISADLDLVEAHALAIDTSSLTGESVPVPAEAGGLALTGSFVVTGEGEGVLVATGIGTDLLPALALGAEPVDPTSLRRPPRRDHFVDGALLRRVFAVLGPVEALVEMTAFLVALAAAGWRPGRSFPSGHALLAASGAAFAAVVIGQCANAFACRSATRWPGRLGWGTNRFLVGAVAVEVVLLAGFLGIPAVARVLDHAPPSLAGWAVALLAAPAVLAADAGHKRLRKRRS